MKTMHSTRKTLLLSVLTAIFAMSLTVLAIMGFASKSAFTADAATNGVTDMSVSLGEDIVVKYYTDATPDDASYLEVVFNGETFKIEEHVDGVFAFNGVAPQQMGDVMEATLKASDGTAIGETKHKSVKSYLESVLVLSQADGQNAMQYAAMKELAVDLLNYGAAAQTYVEYNTDALANADLTTDQAALATGAVKVATSDKASTGDMFVGAGVRFDSKLGLYFVFEAEDTENLTLKINGEDAEYKAYTTAGQYIAYYDNFTATDMNKSVTAVLSDTTGELATATYSLKAYVNSYGSADNALANLVNATYAYGYAAVAYSAEYMIVDPTFETAGSVSMSDDKDYDYTDSKYADVTLPVLNTTDYTATTTKTANTGKDLGSTTFTHEASGLSWKFMVDDCILVNGKLYLHYTIEDAAIVGATITRTAEGYTVAATEDVSTTPVLSYGLPLTITGNFTYSTVSEFRADTYIGTESATGSITVNVSGKDGVYLRNSCEVQVVNGMIKVVGTSVTGNSAFVLNPGTLTVGKNGKIVTEGTWEHSIYAKGAVNVNGTAELSSPLTMVGYPATLDGATVTASAITVTSKGVFNVTGATTLTVNGTITTTSSRFIVDGVEATVSAQKFTQTKGALVTNEEAEYGFDAALFVRQGALKINGTVSKIYSLQVGSEKDNTTGTLEIKSSGNGLEVYQPSSGEALAAKYVFAKGAFNLTCGSTSKSGLMLSYNVSTSTQTSELYFGDVDVVANTMEQFAYARRATSGTWTISEKATFSGTNIKTNWLYTPKSTTLTVKAAAQMENVEHEGTTGTANVILSKVYNYTAATQIAAANLESIFPTTTAYDSYEFVSWVE